MTTIVSIQARMGSTRLPGKVLMDLDGKPMLRRVWDACAGPWERMVLTSTSEADDQLFQWCYEQNIPCQRGPEHNVLARYMHVADNMRPDCLVRVCGDAPFIRSEWISDAVAEGVPVFIPNALHSGSWRDWRVADRAAEFVDEHAGHDWFFQHGKILYRTPHDYLMVNTQDDLEEARRRLSQSRAMG